MLSSFLCLNSHKKAFALAEVMVTLFVITLALVLIGSIGKQLGTFTNKSKQVASVLELRSRTAIMIRDPGKWLDKLRVMPTSISGNVAQFGSCLPSVTSPTTAFNCPIDVITPLDTELQSHTNSGQFKVMDTELVDAAGVKIAGTMSGVKAHYLNNDGSVCVSVDASTKCPLQSIGYFLREFVGASTNPGNVKFLIKILNNAAFNGERNLTPMKPQFVKLELGTDWSVTNATSTSSTCIYPNVQVGIKPDGSPMCMSPTARCSPGEYTLGLKPDGTLNCKTPIACSGTTPKTTFNPSTGDIECVSNTPCSNAGEVFLGFYTGSGQAMCTVLSSSCSQGQVQLGPTTADCRTVPTNCTAEQELAFVNGVLSCTTSNNPGGVCGEGKIVVGIDMNGTPQCQDERVPKCAAGQSLKSLGNGQFACSEAIPQCAAGQNLIANAGGGYSCANPPPTLTVPSCAAGQILASNNSGGLMCAAMPTPRTRCRICHKPHSYDWVCTGWVNTSGGLSEAGPFVDHGDTGKKSHIRLSCETY